MSPLLIHGPTRLLLINYSEQVIAVNAATAPRRPPDTQPASQPSIAGSVHSARKTACYFKHCQPVEVLTAIAAA